MRDEQTIINKNLIPLFLVLVTLLGFALRYSFFVGSVFPLHDGGFFYVLVNDLISNNFHLPEYSSYNHASIPFVYPPFGIYFVGMIETIFGVDRLQLFRIIPLVIATLTIPAFYFLALEINKEKWSALTATTIYSLLPMSYRWLILGGGVTRSFGALYGILALLFVVRFLKSGRIIDAILASSFCGLTALSHPEWAWFIFYSIGIICILKIIAKEKRIIFRAIVILLGTSIIVLPWLFTVVYRHGKSIIQPLLDHGFSRWIDIIHLFFVNWSNELIVSIFTILAIIGIARSIKAKEYFVVLWLVLVFFLQGRSTDQKAVIPLALLGGIGVKAAIEYIQIKISNRIHLRALIIIIIGAYIYSFMGSIISNASIIRQLPNHFSQGIDWIQKETLAKTTFLVITGEDWIYDNSSEWITALTGRESISVVQGYEWLPGFSERISRYDNLQYEYTKGMSDLVTWMKYNKIHADYLIFPMMNKVDASNWETQPAFHLSDALLYPGIVLAYEDESLLILDLRTIFSD